MRKFNKVIHIALNFFKNKKRPVVCMKKKQSIPSLTRFIPVLHKKRDFGINVLVMLMIFKPSTLGFYHLRYVFCQRKNMCF